MSLSSTNTDKAARTKLHASNVQNYCRQLEHTLEAYCATDRKSVPSHRTPSEFVASAHQHYQSFLGRLGLVSPEKYCDQADISLDYSVSREVV